MVAPTLCYKQGVGSEQQCSCRVATSFHLCFGDVYVVQNTSNINSGRALASLNETFPGGPEDILAGSFYEVCIVAHMGGF